MSHDKRRFDRDQHRHVDRARCSSKSRAFRRNLTAISTSAQGEIMTPANHAASAAAAMNAPERFSWDEICRRYPDEWVVMTEIEWVNDTDFEFDTALVLAHHKTRNEASRSVKAAFTRYRVVGSFFTGEEIPPTYSLLNL
jgi:hypothetical protein